ncbi:hypothetical protein [Streptomyces pseudogriseolus]|uniref:hypothetical protein n=1 Tax=Streptomyces pseudogriseolus TaxID=36817 RepID=UPI001CE29A5A|nr:hypothetical protein [Streptomyces pseudogriseolus]
MAPLIRRTDLNATLVYRSPYEPAVFFELAGRDYAITVATAVGKDVITDAQVTLTARERDLAPGVRWVLIYARVTGQEIGAEVSALLRAQGVLLDRDHLEVAVCALAPLTALIRAAFRPPRPPHTPLHELLLQEPSEPAPALDLAARPAGTPSVPSRASAGIDLRVVLAGESWPVRPSGMAWESAERVLITTEAGVAEMNLQRGGTRWRLPLPGVHGDAAVQADGSVWVLCGPAVV